MTRGLIVCAIVGVLMSVTGAAFACLQPDGTHKPEAQPATASPTALSTNAPASEAPDEDLTEAAPDEPEAAPATTAPSGAGLLWSETFDSADAAKDWEVTSGALAVKDGSGWTNSDVFRANSQKSFAGNISISIDIRQNKDIHNGNCQGAGTCWCGSHVWLRQASQYDLYYASVNRADNKIVVKRKVPCGSDNKGTYFDLGAYTPHGWQVGKWQRFVITVKDTTDGVTIAVYDANQSTTTPVLTATDKGRHQPGLECRLHHAGQDGQRAVSTTARRFGRGARRRRRLQLRQPHGPQGLALRLPVLESPTWRPRWPLALIRAK